MLVRAFIVFLASVAAFTARAASFDELFLDKTMRVDYFHTATPKGDEILALDRVVSDGPWPGSRTYLVDTSNLGKYLFEVIDRDTNQVVFSRGFASVYGEWETTDEAKERPGTFHESLRFPVAEEAGAGGAEEARRAERVPADLVDGRRSDVRAS